MDILDFVGHMVTVVNATVGCCNMKATTENHKEMNIICSNKTYKKGGKLDLAHRS